MYMILAELPCSITFYETRLGSIIDSIIEPFASFITHLEQVL